MAVREELLVPDRSPRRHRLCVGANRFRDRLPANRFGKPVKDQGGGGSAI